MLLEKDRGKYRNILLTGPAICGKTFILNPLNVVYKTFSNPASTSFAWIGVENCEILFLNDFRWSSQILAWHDMLFSFRHSGILHGKTKAAVYSWTGFRRTNDKNDEGKMETLRTD